MDIKAERLQHFNLYWKEEQAYVLWWCWVLTQQSNALKPRWFGSIAVFWVNLQDSFLTQN